MRTYITALTIVQGTRTTALLTSNGAKDFVFFFATNAWQTVVRLAFTIQMYLMSKYCLKWRWTLWTCVHLFETMLL